MDRTIKGINTKPHIYNMSYREIAKELNISHQRVNQIEKSALEKLRKGIISRLISRGLVPQGIKVSKDEMQDILVKIF